MIFKLNKIDIDHLNRLIETRMYNDEVASFLNENVINQVLSEEEINENKITRLNINDYLNNLYLTNVKPKEIKYKNYEIKYEEYKLNQCFLFDEININPNDYYLIKNKVGYFTNNFKYLTIQKDNTTWMSIIPHEINTMKIDQNKLTKHIYVLGLGLGYFPYINEQYINKITIIEKDQNIIDLFNQFIFPYFKNKDKYEIIHDDAFSYISKINKNDFVFIDLWHDVNDGLTMFVNLFKKMKEFKNKYFWIKKSLLAGFRNLLINLIEEEFYHPNEFNYDKANNDVDKIINQLHYYLKNKKISSYLEIKELLKDDSLENIILAM